MFQRDRPTGAQGGHDAAWLGRPGRFSARGLERDIHRRTADALRYRERASDEKHKPDKPSITQDAATAEEHIQESPTHETKDGVARTPQVTTQEKEPVEPAPSLDCKTERDHYHEACKALNAKYHNANCKRHGIYSDCANDYQGCHAFYITNAFADTHCGKPGYVERGKTIIEEYLRCLDQCNNHRLSRSETRKYSKSDLRNCAAACRDTAGKALKTHNRE
jgi:hypothetical protein